ncbi:MAG: aspartate aminotransferase family protein [Chloroflexota bacterium]
MVTTPTDTQAQTFTDTIIQGEADHVLNTYNRPPFMLVHGEGVTLYDSEGNAYLDFVAGIAVNALGYADPEIVETIEQGARGLLHVSNLYHTAPHVDLARMLTERSFADKVFFCNSGAEANEAAIKFSRKHAWMDNDTSRTEFVAFTGSFHGRTMGALALTAREKYQKPFRPLMPGVTLAEYNNLESAAAAITEKTAAVFVEPVQGEGGINPATAEFLQGLRKLCDERGALLIFDQVQCGMGRTGDLFSHQFSGVEPDILTLAKSLGGGLPIGAVLVNEKVASAIQPGDHGSTFAGGPLVTQVAQVVVRRVSEPDMLAHIAEMGEYLREQLCKIESKHIVEVRGRGLMCAMELDTTAAPVIEAGYKHGLLLVNAGPNVVRFVPPLVIEKEHIDTMIGRLTTAMGEAGLMA